MEGGMKRTLMARGYADGVIRIGRVGWIFLAFTQVNTYCKLYFSDGLYKPMFTLISRCYLSMDWIDLLIGILNVD